MLDALVELAETRLEPALGGRVGFEGCTPPRPFEVRLLANGAIVSRYSYTPSAGYTGVSAPYFLQYWRTTADDTGTLPLDPGTYQLQIGEASAGDGILVYQEYPLQLFATGPNPNVDYDRGESKDADVDGDHVTDCWESTWFGNLTEGAYDDYDRDGITNIEEFQLGLNPANSDQDGDGNLDGEERRLGLDLTAPHNGVVTPSPAFFAGKLNPALPTVVLVHGLQGRGDCDRSDPAQGDQCQVAPDADDLWLGSSPLGAATLIRDALGGPDQVNLVQYVWEGAYQTGMVPTRDGYIKARGEVVNAAERLARLLHDGLGPTYAQKMHFIGHSLGTAVSAYAIRAYTDMKRTVAQQIQFTALDRPDRIAKIPDFASWEALPLEITGEVLTAWGVARLMAEAGCVTGTLFNGVLSKICHPMLTAVDTVVNRVADPNLDAAYRIMITADASVQAQSNFGFNGDFFLAVLGAVAHPAIDLRVENYYSWDDLTISREHRYAIQRTGVGAPAAGALYNQALFDPSYVGMSFFQNEAIARVANNNHSAVTQWYRWTIAPNAPQFGRPACAAGGSFIRPQTPEWPMTLADTETPDYAPLGLLREPYGPEWAESLDPCGDVGWKRSILTGANPLPRFGNGPAARSRYDIDLAHLHADSFEALGDCRLGVDQDTGTTQISCREHSSPLALVDLDLPADTAFLDFEYRFGTGSDGDFAALLVDREEVWKVAADSAVPGEFHDSGPIPIDGLAPGIHSLMLRLFGEGEANAQIEIRNVRVMTKAPPAANAGPDSASRTGAARVTLDGSASAGAGPLSFTWTQTQGPAVTLSDATTANPWFVPTAWGSYGFSLVVGDDGGASPPDEVLVQVARAGDLDGDNDIDAADYSRFTAAFGRCAGAAGFLAAADLDDSGCVNFVDYQQWNGYYRASR